MDSKEGNFKLMGLVLILSLLVAAFWNKLVWLKDSVHYVFDPTAGFLLGWNLTWGMLIIVFVISLITVLIQKYATDQKTLKELKKEQKIIKEEMKKYRDHPERIMQLQKKQLEFLPKTMKLSMRAIVYTAIPFIIFFKWFEDYFGAVAAATGEPVRFLGFLGWFLFYLIFTMIFSAIIKKKFDIV